MNATGGTAYVQRLSGVFFEMNALDADAHHLAVHLDVEIALDTQRFVVLRDLVVLRHVGIEVVLAGEAAPRRDAAVQRQPDANGRLDRNRVGHRQRAWQAETRRAGVRVGWRTEGGGTPAEHLRPGAELDMGLETEYRLERRECVVVGGHSAGACSISGPPQRSFSAASSAAPTR